MEIIYQVVFFVLAALIIGSALLVVTAKNVIHAALWMISSFFGVAALYMLMQAEFLAIVQVLVYIGAISVLILFAIMLTRHVTGEGVQQLYQRWWIGAVVSAGLFAAVIAPTVLNHPWKSDLASTVVLTEGNAADTATDATIADATTAGAADSEQIVGSLQLGQAFIQEYLLPFQVGAVLLLMALVGALVIAYEERERRRSVLTLAEEVALRKRREQASE